MRHPLCCHCHFLQEIPMYTGIEKGKHMMHKYNGYILNEIQWNITV